MTEEELKAEIADLQAQLAAVQVRNEEMSGEMQETKSRADKLDGELASARHKIEELTTEKVRFDATDVGQIKSQNAALLRQLNAEKQRRMDAESPERLRAAVQRRVTLEGKALAVLGEDSRLDELTDRQIMEQVIDHIQGAKMTSEHSDDYVRARFDSATEGYERGAAALARVREQSVVRAGERRNDSNNAREAMIERNRNAWKPAEAKA